MKIRAVLFDIDGTLIDSNEMHVTAWQEAFAGISANFDRQIIHDQIGKGTDKLLPTLLPDLDKAAQEKLGEVHGKIFKSKFLKQAKPFPKAHELLSHVFGLGQQIILASSASKAELDYYLGLLDARDLIKGMVCSDDVEQTKPAPDIFGVALEKLPGLVASDVIAVGDTPYDVEAANKCGISTIALRSGRFSDDVLQRAGAVAIYNDVADLLADYEASPLGR